MTVLIEGLRQMPDRTYVSFLNLNQEGAMLEDDSTYFTRRAEAELDQAQRATNPQVVRAHFMLAEAYLERLQPDARASIEQRT